MAKYTSVSVSEAQKQEVKELIFQKAWLGYRSVAEFVADAIREKLNKCKMEISSQGEESDRY